MNATDPPGVRILQLDERGLVEHLDALADVLHATVVAGASVGFVMPFELEESRAFWRQRVQPGVRAGTRDLFIALARDRLAGTVQLDVDTMPNQSHRAEVSKLLVHPDFRRRGIGRALMDVLVARAATRGRSLLTLDTRSGDHAEPLYRAMGFRIAGSIPGYCRAPDGGVLEATTYMYKAL